MRIGIVGGGQLARMMILAGDPLGMEFMILDPAEDATASKIAEHIIAPYNDIEALTQLANKVDVVTFDFENVPAPAMATLQQHCRVYPPPIALATAQDRLSEKQLFAKHGIQTAPYQAIDNLQQLQDAVQQLGTPCILKTRRLGYDGKGQFSINTAQDCAQAWQSIGQQPAILESFVDFEREVSIIAVLGHHNDVDNNVPMAFYPLIENVHQKGILHISRAPYPDDSLSLTAQQLVLPLLQSLNYVGVITIEFFLQNGQLIANEIAPRVHNSGHWTIEGAHCSQFENHLRAISGLPLGSTKPINGYIAMLNFISQMPDINDVCAIENCHVHDYHKEPREGRKVGHATLTAETLEQRETNLATLLTTLY